MSTTQEKPLTHFKTKADTLRTLSTLLRKSSVEELHTFTQGEWERNSQEVVQSVKNKFLGKTIIIRSSALSEDTAEYSNAGYFESILDVDSADIEAIFSAANAVIESYNTKDCGHPQNPVLVQTQTMDVVCSGTLLTRDYNGAPYYVVNYSEEDTTSVTSGRHSKSVKILQSPRRNVPVEFAALLEAVEEVRGYAHPQAPLDLEFGIKADGSIIIFQVRPLVASKAAAFNDDKILARVAQLKDNFTQLSQARSHLDGAETLLGDMPDWNPAEIIGNSPHLLAVSLYDEIITGSIWHQARTSQGYMNVHPAKLVIQIGNKPYVDIRNTFNSLVPSSITPKLRKKLLTFYLNKLKANPQLQDKVEFEILYTCYDLTFDRRVRELVEAGFTRGEIANLKSATLQLTNDLVLNNTIQKDIQQNEELERYRLSLSLLGGASVQEYIERTRELLEACKKNGTLQFSRIARLGFIGKTLLRSLVSENVINEATYDGFLRSVNTVASDFARDTDLLTHNHMSKEEFLKRYGHLRPGTYDITIPRYDATEDYFKVSTRVKKSETVYSEPPFVFTQEQHAVISQELRKHGLTMTSSELFDFVKDATEAREYSKFLFSRSLSDAIEAIACAGALLGFSREELSHLDIDTIKNARLKDDESIQAHWKDAISQNKSDYELNNYLLLPPVIFSQDDLEIVSYYDSRPSFITSKKTTGDIIVLNGEAQEDISGKIVVIESADPGYDWVFTKNPAALITKYGGPASHMAIRCAELGLPAAIGVGEILYTSLAQAASVVVDCENERIEPHGRVG